jgi:dienelactone hydrolase
MWAQAVAFARRGWVAVAFMRRGYGRSEGGWVENYGSCANPDYTTAGRTAASDIAAVAKFMATEPYVAKGRWISVGVSAGAFATVALTADAPRDLAAAIGFAPGRGSSGPDTVCGEKQLVSAFAQYGKTSRTPLLWVSAENDHFFDPRLTARLTAAFSNTGGDVTFVKTPPFGSDGHQLFEAATGIPIWSPIVDRFLASNNLVLRDKLIDVPLPDVRPPSVPEWPRSRGIRNLSRQRTQQGFCGRRRITFRVGYRPPDDRSGGQGCARILRARGQMRDRQRQQQVDRINASAGWR